MSSAFAKQAAAYLSDSEELDAEDRGSAVRRLRNILVYGALAVGGAYLGSRALSMTDRDVQQAIDNAGAKLDSAKSNLRAGLGMPEPTPEPVFERNKLSPALASGAAAFGGALGRTAVLGGKAYDASSLDRTARSELRNPRSGAVANLSEGATAARERLLATQGRGAGDGLRFFTPRDEPPAQGKGGGKKGGGKPAKKIKNPLRDSILEFDADPGKPLPSRPPRFTSPAAMAAAMAQSDQPVTVRGDAVLFDGRQVSSSKNRAINRATREELDSIRRALRQEDAAISGRIRAKSPLRGNRLGTILSAGIWGAVPFAGTYAGVHGAQSLNTPGRGDEAPAWVGRWTQPTTDEGGR